MHDNKEVDKSRAEMHDNEEADKSCGWGARSAWLFHTRRGTLLV